MNRRVPKQTAKPEASIQAGSRSDMRGSRRAALIEPDTKETAASSRGNFRDSASPVSYDPDCGHNFGLFSVFSPARAPLQPKLKINKQGDSYEQEADRVAEQVMRMPGPAVRRKASYPEGASLREKGEKVVRTKSVEITPLIQRQANEFVYGNRCNLFDFPDRVEICVINDRDMHSKERACQGNQRYAFTRTSLVHSYLDDPCPDGRLRCSLKVLPGTKPSFIEPCDKAILATEEQAGKGSVRTTSDTEQIMTSKAGEATGSQKDEEEEQVQAKLDSSRAQEATPSAESAVESLRGGGQPLPDDTRAFFEPRFGHDFSTVRIHHDARAAESARAVNAQAFTTGNNIVFDAGRYSPGTETGKRLLAHELTHVVQQEGSAPFSHGIQRQRKTPDFNEYLEEGAMLLGRAQFGLSAGEKAGQDPQDSYDASAWTEDIKVRGVIKAKISPWDAFNKLVNSIDKDIPKAGGGTTRWRFDCFEFVPLIRIYAYWRTLSKDAFNRKFTPLELGFHAKTKLRWEKNVPQAERPGEAPFTYKLDESGHPEMDARKEGGSTVFAPVKVPIGKSWATLLKDAPVGTQVTWSNFDAAIKCSGAGSRPSFCDFENENTTKLGPDRYSAFPLGIISESEIKQAMARAVFGSSPIPSDYVEKNIYISSVRYPIR